MTDFVLKLQAHRDRCKATEHIPVCHIWSANHEQCFVCQEFALLTHLTMQADRDKREAAERAAREETEAAEAAARQLADEQAAASAKEANLKQALQSKREVGMEA